MDRLLTLTPFQYQVDIAYVGDKIIIGSLIKDNHFGRDGILCKLGEILSKIPDDCSDIKSSILSSFEDLRLSDRHQDELHVKS